MWPKLADPVIWGIYDARTGHRVTSAGFRSQQHAATTIELWYRRACRGWPAFVPADVRYFRPETVR